MGVAALVATRMAAKRMWLPFTSKISANSVQDEDMQKRKDFEEELQLEDEGVASLRRVIF